MHRPSPARARFTATPRDTGNSPLYITADPMPPVAIILALLIIAAPVVGTAAGRLVKAGYGELIVTAAAGYTRRDGHQRRHAPRRRHSPLQRPAGPQQRRGLRHQRELQPLDRHGAGDVCFGPGGGGFSAEGGNLVVNSTAAPRRQFQPARRQPGRRQHVYSTGVLDFQNPIVLNGPFTVTTSTVPGGTYAGHQATWAPPTPSSPAGSAARAA